MAEFTLPRNSKIVKGKNFDFSGKSKNKKILMFTDGHRMMI